jgi:large conductance mechanosensitive channel
MADPSVFVREAGQRALSFVEGFKAFALRGNVVDMAVGVIIGAAFGKLIDSLVKNVIMPLISYITPSTDFSKWHLGRVAIGNLLNDVLSFLIVAFALYVFLVKFVGMLIRFRKEEAAKPLTTDQQLLSEIRDLLKAQAQH